MSVRVELIDDAIADLAKLAESGKLKAFFKKLLEIEAKGSQAGEPLGRDLVGWRKITVGNRDWRIVFQVDKAETVATMMELLGSRRERKAAQKRRSSEAAKN